MKRIQSNYDDNVASHSITGSSHEYASPPGAPNPLAGPADYLTVPVYNDTYPTIDPTKVDPKGKPVLIVGASRGIGRAIAISFAKAGASYIAIGAQSDQTHVIQDIVAAAESAGRGIPRPLRGDKTVGVVSSTAAHSAHTYGVSDYETSKLAQLRFAEFISAEYGDKRALAYCIHPGNIAANMWVGGVPEDLKHVVVETPELPTNTLVKLTKEKREWLAGRYIN
ncbi:MAG: hypothetical protein Q9181_001238 [Wetmoreana brouardii]